MAEPADDVALPESAPSNEREAQSADARDLDASALARLLCLASPAMALLIWGLRGAPGSAQSYLFLAVIGAILALMVGLIRRR